MNDKKVLVYRGGISQAQSASKLLSDYGFPEEQISIATDYQTAVRLLYGSHRSKEDLLDLKDKPAGFSPSNFDFVLAGAGNNSDFLRQHVVRVCGIPFGILTAATVPKVLKEAATFILFASELSRREIVEKAMSSFSSALQHGAPYDVPTWSKRKNGIRFDRDWNI